jgi:hypothetical protein
MGGNFMRGFGFGALGSAALSGYESLTGGYAPDFGPGDDRVPTVSSSDCGLPGSSCYKLDASDHVPADYVDVNLFGTNQGGTGCFAQSQLCSRILDKVPGFQGIALLHDNVVASRAGQLWNFGTMLPSAILTYAAFVGEYGVPRVLTTPYYNLPTGPLDPRF